MRKTLHPWEKLEVKDTPGGIPDVVYVNHGPEVRCDPGGGGGGGRDYSSEGSGGSRSWAPIQLGARSPAKALGKKNYNQLVGGIYNYIKSYVKNTTDVEYQRGQYEKMKGAEGQIESYQSKIDKIADQLAVSFGASIQPDELKTFPLDSFIQSNLKEIYANAKGVFEGSLDLDRTQIKTIVDSHTSTLMSGFRQQRRQLQQALTSKGIDPDSPQGRAQLQSLETDIARGKGDVARQILSQEYAARPERKMAALGAMGQTTGQAQSYVSDQSRRWMDQYRTKLGAAELQMQGLLASAGLGQQGIANTYNQYELNKQNMLLPMNIIGQYAMPYMSEVGRQDIAAHSGASQSWGSQSSSGSQWGQSPMWGLGAGLTGGALAGGGYALGSWLSQPATAATTSWPMFL